jgi:hypothetical protein
LLALAAIARYHPSAWAKDRTVATLLVRKLEPELVVRPRRRAPAHGRSAEARHRAILQAALQPTLTGAELLEPLREGEFWPPGTDPGEWRQDDCGEPADF